MDVARFSDVVRPETFERWNVGELVPKASDGGPLLQSKKQMKQKSIYYVSPDAQILNAYKGMIPSDRIQGHLMHDQDYPTLPEDKPKYVCNTIQTFKQADDKFPEE